MADSGKPPGPRDAPKPASGPIYGFSEQGFKRVTNATKLVEKELVPAVQGRAPRGPIGVGTRLTYAKAPSGGIPARAGDQAGRAECELYFISATGVFTSKGITAKVWNGFGSIVGAGSKYLIVSNFCHSWNVVSEDCA